MDAGNAGHKRKTPENNNKEKKTKEGEKKRKCLSALLHGKRSRICLNRCFRVSSPPMDVGMDELAPPPPGLQPLFGPRRDLCQ